ncbi:MAG TPA: TlpA disulfide reductase family protein [Terracidiphilus sp.]|nr:TlpA disulfide reductase family protein [Terracidiphilus sp.]
MSAAASRGSRGEAPAGPDAATGARTWISGLMMACLLLGAWFAACSRTACAAESLLNKKAPEFTRRDLNGGNLDLATFRGKVVLLNFWATWCAPCQVEMPRFVQWQRQYGPQGFQVIGISMDDDPELARKLYARLKLNYPVAMGDEKLGELYGGVLGLPLTYLVDRNGEVRARFQGETDLKTIEKRLKALLFKH